MTGVVIAFAGPIKSGKSSLSKELAVTLGYPWVSFGDQVRAEAAARRLDCGRDSLQELGQVLVRDDPRGFCASVLHQADWRAGGPLVIDGLRHKRVLEFLVELVTPAEVKIVYVEASVRIRADRLTTLTGESSSVERYDRHDVESEVEDLKRISDFIVDGGSDADEAVRTVVEWAGGLARE